MTNREVTQSIATRLAAKVLSIMLGLTLTIVAGVTPLPAQSSVNKWGAHGKYDTELPVPSIEGRPGQKDSSALNEINTFAAVTTPENWPGIEAHGSLIVGGGQTLREFPASLVIERGRRYRLDVQADAESNSVRVDGYSGARMQPNGALQPIPVTQLGSPFFLPSELCETANRAGVTVIDDGFASVEGLRLHRITIVAPALPAGGSTLTAMGAATATAFYFEPATHYLVKRVLTGHYAGHVSRQYLQVTTYNDYRKIDGAVVPFLISETNNGQHGMTFKAADVTKVMHHEDSYFRF